MNTWILIVIILALLVLAAILRVRYELCHLAVTRYTIASEKIREEDSLRVCFLSDLHGRQYGPENQDFYDKIKEAEPDAILIAGDMLTAKAEPAFAQSIAVYRELLKIAPVYAAFGNHEKRMSLPGRPLYEDFCRYQETLKEAGVCWLPNAGVSLNQSISVYGLDIDFRYYRKIRRENYEIGQMKQDLASVSEECFNIILAHNPGFFPTYAAYGGDLYLAGHYHGGAVRLAGKIGLISPQFRPFPRYSKGRYRKDGTEMIVSAGCGTHKVNLRLFNKPEIVVIDLHGHSIQTGSI